MNSLYFEEFFKELNNVESFNDISLSFLIKTNEDNKKNVKKQLNEKKEKMKFLREKIMICVSKNIISVNDSLNMLNALSNFESILDKMIQIDNFSLEDFNKTKDNMFNALHSIEVIEREIFNNYLEIIKEDYKNGKIDYETVKGIVENSNMTESEKKEYYKIISKVKINQSSTSINNDAEQQAIEEDKGLSTEETSTENEPKTENKSEEQSVLDIATPTSLSFEEQIERLEYDKGENLATTIREISNENDLNTLDERIEELKTKRDKKGNLSFSDSLKLYNLLEQKQVLEQIDIKNTSRQEKREEKLFKNTLKQEKINDKLDSIRNLDSNSYLGRFISNQVEKRLDKKIYNLKQKQVKLVNKQKLSTLTSLKIQKKRIQRAATLKTIKHGVVNIPSQIKNTIIDIKNLVSKPERLEELRRSQIVMTSIPQTISIDEDYLMSSITI